MRSSAAFGSGKMLTAVLCAMVNGKEAVVEELVLHRVGDARTTTVLGGRATVVRDEVELAFLQRFFLKPFANMAATYEFTHAVELSYNVLNGLCADLQAGKDLYTVSVAMVKHLEEVSQHHNINGGDLYVVRFSNVELGTAAYDAVGIFKFNDKETFIEPKVQDDAIGMRLRRGLGNAKPNKACLVLFTPEAPTLFVIDDNDNTEYWQKDFIGHRPKNDHVNNTNSVLDITKNFITKQMPQDFMVAKADQIDLLNRSVQYFKENEEFDREEFAQQVFSDEAVVRSFNQYGDDYQERNHVDIPDAFEISAHAVKRQSRVFKSVIKLDKNFHIYVHGDRNKIEQGVDDNGRKFYKIYYEEES